MLIIGSVSSVTAFSPYFLMFGRTPKIHLDRSYTSRPRTGILSKLCQKLQAKLKWAYQKAQENNKKESESQKRYYDQKIKCMSLKPDDLVLVHVKVPSGQE